MTVVEGLGDALKIVMKVKGHKKSWRTYEIYSEWQMENCQEALERAIKRYRADVIRVQRHKQKARTPD